MPKVFAARADAIADATSNLETPAIIFRKEKFNHVAGWFYRPAIFSGMTNEKIIIGLVGQMASGKGTIAEYLRDKHGADFFTFSTVLRDVLNRLHQKYAAPTCRKLPWLSANILAKIF